MADSQHSAFFEQYAPMAIKQQQMYGIPASVTLAQMAIESGYGKGRAIVEGNNAFCVKGKYNGQFILISDDQKNEMFKKYETLQQSFDDHSKVLLGKNYAHCRGLASTDYEGWCNGLQSGKSTGAKYATDPNYSSKLLSVIKSNGLDRYDRMAVQQAEQPIGYMRGANLPAPAADVASRNSGSTVLTPVEGHWAMPIDSDRLILTCDYGDTKYHSSPHKGIDLRAPVPTAIHATEDNGTVIKSGRNGSAGNQVTVLYQRSDGSSYEVSYLHLSKCDVEVGDQVKAGDVLGMTGNTGRSMAPHLDIRIQKGGEWIDPKDYLAEIAVRGNLSTALVDKASGEELLAQRKESLSIGDVSAADQPLLAQQQAQQEEQQNNDLLSFLQQGQQYGQGQDFITSILSGLFMGALSMAMQLDHMSSDVSVDASASQSEQQDAAQEQMTAIQRRRDTIDPSHARQMASMTFEANKQEESQGQGMRLS